jgi:hypothetical protein
MLSAGSRPGRLPWLQSKECDCPVGVVVGGDLVVVDPRHAHSLVAGRRRWTKPAMARLAVACPGGGDLVAPPWLPGERGVDQFFQRLAVEQAIQCPSGGGMADHHNCAPVPGASQVAEELPNAGDDLPVALAAREGWSMWRERSAASWATGMPLCVP